MDLDEEELKATRILNGADKSINRLNMSEEKAIEIIQVFNLAAGINTISKEEFEDVKKAQKVILNLVEKQQKEIEMLKKSNDYWVELYCKVSNNNAKQSKELEAINKKCKELGWI